MLRFALFAIAAAAFLAISPGASAQSPQLPAIDANGDTAPLTADQLDPQERAQLAMLPAGSDDARKFLYTRGFLRYARLVVDKTLPAKDLPALPARENWDRKFLSEEEARNIVDVALGMNMATMIKAAPRIMARAATRDLPAVTADGKTQPLAVDQLDTQERALFAALAVGSDDARKFLYTRGYLRFCRLVVEGALPPLDLPELPDRENWDRKFLNEEEAKNVVDVALGRQLIAMMTPPPAQ